jgi:hypothetical protein
LHESHFDHNQPGTNPTCHLLAGGHSIFCIQFQQHALHWCPGQQPFPALAQCHPLYSFEFQILNSSRWWWIESDLNIQKATWASLTHPTSLWHLLLPRGCDHCAQVNTRGLHWVMRSHTPSWTQTL